MGLITTIMSSLCTLWVCFFSSPSLFLKSFSDLSIPDKNVWRNAAVFNTNMHCVKSRAAGLTGCVHRLHCCSSGCRLQVCSAAYRRVRRTTGPPSTSCSALFAAVTQSSPVKHPQSACRHRYHTNTGILREFTSASLRGSEPVKLY